MPDIEPIERVVELDRNQPEGRLDFWTYLDRVGSEERVERGRLLLAQHERKSATGSQRPISAESGRRRLDVRAPTGIAVGVDGGDADQFLEEFNDGVGHGETIDSRVRGGDLFLRCSLRCFDEKR